VPPAKSPVPPGFLHLRSLTIRQPFERQRQEFPFNLPILQGIETLEFTTPVTFFVGENGSGKSTVLEALAYAAGLPAVGSEHLERDPSLAHARQLGGNFRLAWQKRTHRGFFLRAEDFFATVLKRVS
jgi:predicted ATPase